MSSLPPPPSPDSLPPPPSGGFSGEQRAPWWKQRKFVIPAAAVLALFIIVAIFGEPESDDVDSATPKTSEPTTPATSEGTEPEPAPEPEPTTTTAPPETTTTTPPTSAAPAQPTGPEVEAAFTAYLDERASAGVLIAQAVQSVTFDGGTVRVIFSPQAAGIDLDLFLTVNPFDNLAEFAGTPMAFANDEGARLRTVVERVTTELSDGTQLGTLTAAEIYEMGTGEKLPD